MRIYLIFECTSKKYVYVDECGETVLPKVGRNSNVDLLSNHMECFGNLRVEAVFGKDKIVILRNTRNELFCAANGNIPFKFLPLPTNSCVQTGHWEKFRLSTRELPEFSGMQLTDEMVQRLKTSWEKNYYEIEQHRNYRAEDMNMDIANRYSQVDLKRLSDCTRQAINRDINARKTAMEDDCIGIEILGTLLNAQDGNVINTASTMPSFNGMMQERLQTMECTENDAKELVFGMYKKFYEYEANQEAIDIFMELGKNLIQQDDEPEVRSKSPKCDSQSQKSNKGM